MAQNHLYKQAGNFVVIPVMRRIAKEIKQAVEKTDTHTRCKSYLD